ncbi:MAG TPA: hypothetical protein VFQ23_22685 [Anaerolineales bacterium]|nr:hypothetical protein [Anaerolineales bacterium]
MSSEERKKILQMVAEGKISPTEAATLMRAMDADSDPVEEEMEVIQTAAGQSSESTAAPEFEEIKARARRFSLIPLWVGVFITVISAWIIYSIQQNGGTGFWFYCMVLPLMFGILLITLGAGGRSSRWLYVDVDRRNAKAGDGPRHITLGFPLPLGFIAWFFRTFGSNIHGMSGGRIEGIIQLMNATKDSNEPFIVNVDEGGNGEHVRVFIG